MKSPLAATSKARCAGPLLKSLFSIGTKNILFATTDRLLMQHLLIFHLTNNEFKFLLGTTTN